MDWETTKEQARVVYTRISHLLLFLQMVLYLVACGIAEKPIGPKAYVQFTYHLVQWTPNRPPASPSVYAKER